MRIVKHSISNYSAGLQIWCDRYMRHLMLPCHGVQCSCMRLNPLLSFEQRLEDCVYCIVLDYNTAKESSKPISSYADTKPPACDHSGC